MWVEEAVEEDAGNGEKEARGGQKYRRGSEELEV